MSNSTAGPFKNLAARPDLAILASAWEMPADASIDDVLAEEQQRLTIMAKDLAAEDTNWRAALGR